MLFENLNMRPEAYSQGYQDGLSCCNTWGRKTAKKLANFKPLNRYEVGKHQAANDWLKDKSPKP